MNEPILIRDWDADAFHRHVLQCEKDGYVARRETYKIAAEVNPDTGEIIHLRTIEIFLPG